MNGVDPVTLEIVEGTLASIEREVETAIGRTARSPMIRTRMTSGPGSMMRGCES